MKHRNLYRSFIDGFTNQTAVGQDERFTLLNGPSPGIAGYHHNQVFNRFTSKDSALREIERKDLELQMKKLTYQDDLTNLPNRRAMNKLVENAIVNQVECAVLSIDLDGFKKINDLYGHEKGDLLLGSTGRKLQEIVSGFGVVGRLGGDEFLVFTEKKSTSELEIFANELLRIFSKPIVIGQNSFSISASVGISQFPIHSSSANQLLSAADIAMYRAKKVRGSHFEFYKAKMTEELSRRLLLEQSFSEDLHQNGFYFVFQPQIDRMTNEMIGFEVLSRLNHPTLGNISPFEFIGIAEETENISKLTHHLMTEVFSKVSSWINSFGFSKKVSFNVTPFLLSQKTFFRDLFELLDEYGIPYNQIELEITEETQLKVNQCTLDNMKVCRERGIQIAIDDFGTGFSMLKSLTHFPIDKIKIDKYFIDQLGKDNQTEAVLKSIIFLGQNLNCTVIAEGVEKLEDVEALTEMGCNYFQGYYFNRPLEMDDFEQKYISN